MTEVKRNIRPEPCLGGWLEDMIFLISLTVNLGLRLENYLGFWQWNSLTI